VRLPISIAFFTHSLSCRHFSPAPPPPSSPRRVTLSLPTSLPYQIIFKPNLSLFSFSLCFLSHAPFYCRLISFMIPCYLSLPLLPGVRIF
jgi:hypothetical protein